MSTVEIVVLNWNGKRFVDGFINTYNNQDYNKDFLKLLFVDNQSSDSSVEYFRNHASKLRTKWDVIQNSKNLGYAGGNNNGIQATKSDYVLVCNNDLELDKKLVSELVWVAEKYNAGVTVPKLVYLNKKGVINNAGSRIDPNNPWPIFEIGANEKDTGQYNEVREISAFCGACVLFSRKFLHEVGVFDRKFFMYFEDGDLSWRGQKAGFKYYYAPKAIAYHYHTGSSKEGSPLFNHYVGRNRLLILTKNGRLIVLIKAWLITLNDHLIKRIKNIFLSFFHKYPRRLAIKEFVLSAKMIFAALLLTPYAFAKRLHLIKEETL